MARKAYAEHSFYCINCGNKGIPLMRKKVSSIRGCTERNSTVFIVSAK